MKIQDRQFVGVLASQNELDASEDVVFVNGLNKLQFNIKSISVPEAEETIATGYISSFDYRTGLEEDEFDADEVRIHSFEKTVQDKVFLYSFAPGEGMRGKLLNGRASLAPRPKLFNPDEPFYSIPVFGGNTESIAYWEEERQFKLFRRCSSKEEMMNRMLKKQPLGSTFGYDPYAYSPSFLIWYSGEKFYAIGHVIYSYEASGLGFVAECGAAVYIEIEDYLDRVIYQQDFNPTLMFIPKSVYQEIEEQILKKEEIAYAVGGENISTDINDDGAFVNHALMSGEVPMTDEGLIEMFDYHSIRSGLHYDIKDLVNFHTAVKTNSLVILSGLSGTGKSSLVDMYAKALGMDREDEERRLLYIPVRPSWNDDSDIIGFADTMNMAYHPSDSGFVDFLIRASLPENRDKLFIVCLDEMNLARVEHYFSNFLSLMQRPAEQRILKLYDEKYEKLFSNAAQYPSRITIGDNIKFVGTVNVDESTYHFSDKVLDRANVIELNVLDYSKDTADSDIKYAREIETPVWTMEDYRNICCGRRVNEKVHEMLWDIHSLLNRAGTRFGVGPRVVSGIDLYLANLPEELSGGITVSEGIDIELAQRVLTKIRGSENEIGEFILENEKDTLTAILDKYSSLSEFTRSRRILKQKQKELKSYGYCI